MNRCKSKAGAAVRTLRAEQVEADALVNLARRIASDLRFGRQSPEVARSVVAAVVAELHLADREPDASAVAWAHAVLSVAAQRCPAAPPGLGA